MDKNKSKIGKVVLIILVIVVLIIIVMMFIVGKKIKILKDLDNKVSSLEDNNNNIYINNILTYVCVYVLYSFFKTGFLSVALAVLELTLKIRVTSNSEMCLSTSAS